MWKKANINAKPIISENKSNLYLILTLVGPYNS